MIFGQPPLKASACPNCGKKAFAKNECQSCGYVHVDMSVDGSVHPRFCPGCGCTYSDGICPKHGVLPESKR